MVMSDTTGTNTSTNPPLVVLLILTWNRRDDVLRCVASLERLAYPNYVPVAVDNASQDDTVEALRARHPQLEIIRNGSNLGYAGGNNVGIRWALARGADYVLLINSDTEVTPRLIDELVEVAESDPRIAVVGSRNVLMEDQRRLWGAYGVLTYGPFVVSTAGEGEPDGPVWNVVRDVDSALGNGYLWRCAALQRVGLLDERFFGYHEDLDWCTRARRMGYRVVYAGSAAIVHKGGSSSDPRQSRTFPRNYFLGRNGILFVRKHATKWQAARFSLLCLAAFSARLGRAVALSVLPMASPKARRSRELLGMELAFARGLVDGMRGSPIPFAEIGLRDADEGRGQCH
jgi:GT2 family glycosyltransferase